MNIEYLKIHRFIDFKLPNKCSIPLALASINYDGVTDGGGEPLPLGETLYRNIPYLKSHLQKCIRRGDAARAVPTAFHLFKLDPVQLLRRLPIISVEDTLIPHFYCTLVWFMVMMSQKATDADKYAMKERDINWILGAVAALCESRGEVVNLYSSTEALDSMGNDAVVEAIEVKAHHEARSFAYSLLLRASFGGMQGDTSMLLNYSKAIITGTVKPITIDPLPLVNAREVEPLDKDYWCLAAIDQHVSQIIDRMQENSTLREVPQEDLKTWMWLHRGSVNCRVNVTHEKPPWHTLANNLADTLARQYIKSNS